MSDIIHLLPDAVANQIAAGEVIQRPASVIKELVENAIDAGATAIQIVIKDAGRTLIQVTDNGFGMSETDARMAFERHATSKIQNADDLFVLRTMGFRGEALASIAAVAQVELRTRKHDDELGVLIEIAGTRIFKQETIQCVAGTTFFIKNLFFNVPARRRFLKSDNVEKSHILNEFYRMVLVNPAVEFSFFDGDDELYRLPAANLKMRIDNVFGSSKKRIPQQLLNIESSSGLVDIIGFIGKPEFAQKSAQQYFFVNGRYMRHPYFHKAVMLAYNQMIQANENPSYFIYFEVDPQSIDINIHPTKTEIKFENEQAIWSILSATVKEALGKFNVIPSIDFDSEGALEIPLNVHPENVKPPQTSFNPAYNPFSTSYKRPALEWEKLYDGFEKTANHSAPEIKPTDSLHFESDFGSGFEFFDSRPEQQKIAGNEESYTANFQFKNRYIITSIKSGMLIIDQQRAHFRVLYEHYLLANKLHIAHSQQLIFPESIALRHEEMLCYQQLEDALKAYGFRIEVAENSLLLVHGTPALLAASGVEALIHEMLDNVQNTGLVTAESVGEKIALLLAKASCIQVGQKLSAEEMSNLIDRLFACENNNYTPDGKKIHTTLTQEEMLARF
ncbi:MAG: DNA mismatch repair protein MutL [Porphyromonadaceae bacterium CG2_30_38_12]|nr:MAG: DNA mismatch repair protein MutL [Porphyromonadaceae bacterium CG2_30_38_12]